MTKPISLFFHKATQLDQLSLLECFLASSITVSSAAPFRRKTLGNPLSDHFFFFQHSYLGASVPKFMCNDMYGVKTKLSNLDGPHPRISPSAAILDVIFTRYHADPEFGEILWKIVFNSE